MKKLHIVGIIALIVLVISATLFVQLQSTIGDPESQLKEEYRTIFSDSSDEPFNENSCKTIESSSGVPDYLKGVNGCTYIKKSGSYDSYAYYESRNFISEDRTSNPNYGATIPSFSGDAISTSIEPSRGSKSLDLKVKDAPIGSELVYIVSGSAGVSSQRDAPDQAINCKVFGAQLDCNSRSCPATVIKLIPDTLNKGKYVVEKNGFKVAQTSFQDFAHASLTCELNTAKWGWRSISGSMQIQYIGTKAQFSCDLTADEVWVQESFKDEFDINDLAFQPTKFCKETRPFVLRDLESGETPIRPDPIPAFNKGDSLTTPEENQIITVNYATYFVAGVTNKCQSNQANIKVDNKWECQDFVKEITQEEADQKLSDIAKERDVVVVDSDNSFSFNAKYPSTSFMFGDKDFKANVDFQCTVEEGDIFTYPNPRESCYINTATFMGKSFTVKDSEDNQVNDFISFKGIIGGKVDHDDDGEFDTKKSLSTTYIFTIKNPFEISIEDNSEVLKGLSKDVTFSLDNNLPQGSGFIKVRQKVKATNQLLPEKKIEETYLAGANSMSVPMDTSNLGINTFTIQAFYRMNVQGTEVLIPSDIFSLNYKVVETVSETLEKTPVEPIVEAAEGQMSWMLIGAITLIVLLFIVIALLIVKHKK